VLLSSLRYTGLVRERFTTWQHCALASLWFAYNVQWSALIPVVLPAQIAAIGGQAHKELLNGIALSAGALIALISAPVAGALSDRSKNSRGRRRGFLLSGIVLNIAALLALAAIGSRGTIRGFLIALFVAQFACNWWGGPYAGLIPDVAPASEQGRASGYMMVMTGAGAIVGTGAAGPILNWAGYWGVYGFAIFILIVCGLVTLAGVSEPRPALVNPALDRKPLFRNFFPNPAIYKDFYVVVMTRAFVTMGAFSITPFFQYFFADLMRDNKAILHGSLLMGGVAIVTLPIALLAGKQADRKGPIPIVWLSGWIMAGTTMVYIIDCFLPSWTFTVVMALIFSSASMAYQAVDWALALSVLPNASQPGKDMGIWHVALVLPQAIAPVISGTLLDLVKRSSQTAAYALVFALTGFWYALGTAPIGKLKAGQVHKMTNLSGR
jgi:MFS family permease